MASADENTPNIVIGDVSLSELTDRSLMRRFQAGNGDAASALYRRYARRLERLAYQQVSPGMAVRVDPEGIVQSVFRTFFRRAEHGQYALADREDLWKLLLVMALNKIRNQALRHRTDKRDVQRTQAIASDNGPAVIDANDHMAFQILKMTVEEVVGGLPVEQREIIWHRIEGCEIEEIVARTGRAKRSIERVLQSFRQRLAKSLELDCQP